MTTEPSADDPLRATDNLRSDLDAFLQRLRATSQRAAVSQEIRTALDTFAGQIAGHCDRVVYFSHYADRVLSAIENAFRRWVPVKSDRVRDQFDIASQWLCSVDTGWYIYLHATSIAVNVNDQAEWNPSFQAFHDHDDVRGLLMEPREARASFDDWRFMQSPDVLYPNLAFIRSHEGDAFFGSEYRALLYFPDDPKFLTDQYEVTVELMMWLGTALKFNERLSQMLSRELSDRMREDLETMVHPPASELDEEHVKAHRRDLDRIGRLRGQAGDVQTLVSKAGVSRYKDHGDLMIRLVEGMKFDRLVELLDRRLAQLDGLYRQIVERIEREAERVTQDRAGVHEQRNQRIGIALAIVSAIIGIGALKDLIEGLVYSMQSPWKERVTSGMMWLALIAVVALIKYWWTHERRTSDRRPA